MLVNTAMEVVVTLSRAKNRRGQIVVREKGPTHRGCSDFGGDHTADFVSDERCWKDAHKSCE